MGTLNPPTSPKTISFKMNHWMRFRVIARESKVPIPIALIVKPMVSENCFTLSPSKYEEVVPIRSS